MLNQTSTRTQTNATVQSLLRILIASYFIAVALHIIPGTDFAALAGLVASPAVAALLSACLVFSLSYMVMLGVHTRIAALLLGLMTLFSAYVTMAQAGADADLGAFWRDLALIAALMLTYAEPVAGSRQRAMLRRRVMPRRIAAAPTATPRPQLVAEQSLHSAEITDLATARKRLKSRPIDLRAPLASDEIENIFLDDMAVAQGH